jgi:hypothetical protein
MRRNNASDRDFPSLATLFKINTAQPPALLILEFQPQEMSADQSNQWEFIQTGVAPDTCKLTTLAFCGE